MLLTVFQIKGVPGHRRERIEAAVAAGGRHASGPHEAWIATDPFRGGVKVLITGRHGFERTVTFALDDDTGVIAEQVRTTMED
jgi:hypothetical protein